MSRMPKIYKERPLLVYAMRYTCSEDIEILKSWCKTHKTNIEKSDEDFLIMTNDIGDTDYVELGDYVVREIDKETMYSCSPKTFDRKFSGMDDYA